MDLAINKPLKKGDKLIIRSVSSEELYTISDDKNILFTNLPNIG